MKKNLRTAITMMAIILVAALALTGCGVDITRVGIPADAAIEKGETYQVVVDYGTDDEAEAAAIEEAAGKLTLVWTSSDEAVATVDDTGLVTALAGGSADVTVSIEGANISSTCHFAVTVPVEAVNAPETLDLTINGIDTANINPAVVPEDATGTTFTYASDDEAIATVDESGLVTAHADGECTITTTAKTDDGSEIKAETKVTVTTAATSIRLESSGGKLYVGNTASIVAYTVPSEAPASTYTYVSSDKSIATVSESGLVTAKKVGSATITVTSAEGFVADYAVVVTAKPVVKNTATTGSSPSGTASTAGTPAATVPVPDASVSAPAPDTSAPAPDPAPAPDTNPAPYDPGVGEGSHGEVIPTDQIDWTKDPSCGSNPNGPHLD